MMLMDKIAVIGDRESIKGFAALGLDIFPCDTHSEGEKIFKKLVNENYGVIYITEHIAMGLSKEIAKTDKMLTPSVVAIPGVIKSENVGREALKAAVIKAVGSDIIFDKE